VLLLAPPAAAHTELVEASPGPDALVEAPPSHLVLVFDGVVQLTADAVVVAAAGGSRVPLGAPAVDAPGTVTVPLPALAPGAYEVAYRVLAEDNHVLEGRYSFAVQADAGADVAGAAQPAPATPAPAAVAPVEDDDDDAGIGVLLIVVAAAIGIAGGLGAWRLSRTTGDDAA